MSCSVVILAAGQGKRMQSQRAKVLHTLADSPFIRHVVNTATLLQPNPLVVVHGHLGEQVKAELSEQAIVWVEQMPPKGTGHAVQQALPVLPPDGVTVILYGDVPLIQIDTLQRMIDAAKENALALLAMHTPEPDGYGRILRNAQGKVIGIVEHKDATPEERAVQEVNTGMMVVPTAWLHRHLPNLKNNNAQGEFYLTDLISLVVQAGDYIEVLYPNFEWEVAGINDRIQQADLERKYQLFQAHRLMQQGVSLRDPERFVYL